MGRSQVKYRATHGRGRGRGRGDATARGGSTSGRGRPGHLRNLGSNAFRFEEHADEQDKEQEIQDDGGRTQFFASEQNYREMGAAPGEHFQSRIMKQWEETDDQAVGVLDLDWIASQLQHLEPSIRYRMDPKYCNDLPFEQQLSDSEEEIVEEQTSVIGAVVAASVPATAAKPDAELDFLLNLSASTSIGVKATPTPTMPTAAVPTPTRTPAETEQLEDWLDDVLDM